jgi:hypothetical protein
MRFEPRDREGLEPVLIRTLEIVCSDSQRVDERLIVIE